MAGSEQKLGTERLGKLIFSMGIPTLIAQVINLLYNIVDRMYIGHIEDVGALALTGVGLTLPVIMIITAFSAFVGAGGAPLAAIALGQGNKERAETILSNGFVLLCIIAAGLMVLFYTIEKPFLYLIGASDATFPFARQYMNIYLIGTPFVLMVIGLNPFITAQGKSNIAMLAVLIGAVINIGLDPIFIFGLNMGVRGAAFATIISQFVSAVWTVHFLMSKKTSLRIKPSRFRLDRRIVGQISSLGVSPFIMQSTESLVTIVLSAGLQRYGGDLYVGSLTILQSIMQLIYVPISGFSQGVQPIISYNFGAGKLDRVRKTYRVVIGIATLSAFLMTLSAILLPGMYAHMFTNDPALSDLVVKVMPIFVFGMLIFGVQMGCQQTFMALGQAKISLFLALLRKVILLVPFAILFPLITNNVMSIYYAECSADILAALTCGVMFTLKIRKILERGPAR